MTISAKVIADSISEQGIRLTTLQLRYPKFIHSEFMTHRVFSRNASSSGAIPVERLIRDVDDDPAMPIYWGSNRSGMQATEEYHDPDRARSYWLQAKNAAVHQAELLNILGLHKQIVNRVLEPFCHINTVVTSTDWVNFFALRRHKDAQPEIHHLADCMYIAMDASRPQLLQPGQWHLPYCNPEDKCESWSAGDDPIRESVARCARVSYLTKEGKKPTVDEDLVLYDRLMNQIPLHASPAEHQATPDYSYEDGEYMHTQLHGNFYGWRQYRKMLPDECVRDR